MDSPNHYQYKYKCLACSLHFVVLSWNPKWQEEHVPFCPECGAKGFELTWIKESPDFIFDVVPGPKNIDEPNN